MTTIVLCGSTRFRDQFKLANYELSKRGYTVLTLADPPADLEPGAPLDPVEKIMFDLVYFEKIRIADAVLVIDSTGMSTYKGQADTSHYIGFSTAREILWAKIQDRPVFSLSMSTGWGYIDDCIQNRYDETYRASHAFLFDGAEKVLRMNQGADVLQDQIDSAQRDMMHAGLSVIASQGGQATSFFATRVLEGAGLDPREDLDVLFAGVIDFDGTLRGKPEKIVVEDFQDPAESEDMTTLPTRKLIGTIIMIQAILEMGRDERIGKRRREMVAKLELTLDTLFGSFGLTQEEVDQARSCNGGLDFPVAEQG